MHVHSVLLHTLMVFFFIVATRYMVYVRTSIVMMTRSLTAMSNSTAHTGAPMTNVDYARDQEALTYMRLLVAPLQALVVDDEPLVNEHLSSLLEQLGYECCGVRDVASAIDAVSRKTFDVAFIDLGLPDRSGLELIAELHELQPDLRLILATGYAAQARLDMQQSEKQLVILDKPFTNSSIKNVLSECGFPSL